MMKWYQKRDFSIKVPLSFQMKLGKLQQRDASASTLFQEMWDECEDIAKAVLETDYFKGILNNNLDPNAYGSLMVQDAYYCFKAQNSYTIAHMPTILIAQSFLQEKNSLIKITMRPTIRFGIYVKIMGSFLDLK